jgi:hypothetical protein
MAQGDVDLPLFATGDGAELVDYFRSDDARRHANVYAAGVTAEAALERFSTNLNRLSAAAIYLALPAIHPTYSFGAERGSEAWAQIGTRDWLREASELLKVIRLSPETETSSEPFRSISIELLARRHVLAGDPAQARAELRDAPSAVFAERALAQLLVTLTDEAARRQPATLLEETSRLLEKAERELTDGGKKPNPRLGTARDQLDSLVRSEQSRRTTRFEIAPEAAGRER